MIEETKISKGYQTVVPARIRKELNIAPGDVLIWEEKDKYIVVKTRKKKTLEAITGIISADCEDCVTLKKKAGRGEI